MRPSSVSLLLFFLFSSFYAFSQCPTIVARGSSQNPNKLCAPVQATVSYTITFAAPLPVGSITNVFFIWNDGQAPTFSAINLAAGGTTFNVTSPTRTFPTASDCQYIVSINVSHDPDGAGALPTSFCGASVQTQTITSWRTDDVNGGTVSLVSPTTGTAIHEVCRGEDIDVILDDLTNWNCNDLIDGIVNDGGGPNADVPNNPNEAIRWQQIVYNTSNPASQIPNIEVDGVPVTGALGADIFADYQDPRGVFQMAAPVIVNDPRRRDALEITAPGGFGAGFPQVGDEFQVTVKYWNFCNPYANDFDNTPVNGDLINGDNPPRTATATIRIVAAPAAPTAADQVVCKGTTPGAFTVSGVPAGATTHWYTNANGTAGTLIQNSATLPIANYAATSTDSLETNVAGYYKVFASYTPNGAGLLCESEKVPVTIIIRQQITTPGEIPGPIATVNHEVCADGTTTYSFGLAADSPVMTPSSPPTPSTQLTTVGGATQYNWSFNTPGNITLTPSGTTNKNVGVVFGTAIFGAGNTTTRNLQVNSTYITGSTCASTNETDPVLIHRVSNGGTLATSPVSGDICSGASKDFVLTGIVGTIQFWEFSTDGGATWNTDTDFGALANPAAKVFTNATTAPVTYRYRVVVKHGPCASVTSNTLTFTVYPVPPQPTIASNPDPAIICADGSTITLTSSNVGAIGSTYRWFKLPDLVTPVQATASNQLVLNTVAQSGDYVVSVRGVAPTNCTSATSDPVTVTIRPLPTAANPTGGGSVCSGNPAPDISWTLTGTAPFDITYTMSPGGPVVVTGHNSTTFTIANPNPGVNTTYQITSLSDANGCGATSMGGTASVLIGGTAPTFSSGPAFATPSTCENGTSTTDPVLNITLDAGSASLANFVLTYTIDGGAPATKTFNTDASSLPTAPISFSEVSLNSVTPSPHVIRLLSLVSAAGCQTTINSNLNFTVNPKPVSATVNVAGICSPASASVNLQTDGINAAGGNSVPSTFSWTAVYPGALTGGAASGTGNIAETLTNSSNAVQTAVFTVTPTSVTGSCAGSNFTVNVPVNPRPFVDNKTVDVCSGSAFTVTPANGVPTALTIVPAGTTYAWGAPIVTGGLTGGSAQTGQSSISQTLINPTTAPQSATYTVTPTSGAAGACVGPNFTVTVTVNPIPVLTSTLAPAAICSGNFSYTPTSATVGATFSWTRAAVVGISQGASSGTVSINETLTNTTSAPVNVTYVITTSANGCGNAGQNVVVTVNPTPVLTLNQSKDICSGENVNYSILLNPVNTPPGTTFTWTAPVMSDLSVQGAAGSGATINDVLINGATTPITATYTVTPTSANLCAGAPRDIVITVNPLPTANPISGQGTVCAGPTIIVYQITPHAGSTYNWTIPPQFDVFGGGGPNDFFVLLRFLAVDPGSNISVVETNVYGCVGPVNTFPISVSSAPGALSINGALLVCKSQQGVVYQIPGANGTSTYTWSASGANIVSATSGPGLDQITVDFGLATSATITASETSMSGCAGTPVTINVNAADRPAMTSVNSDIICSGAAPVINFTSSLGAGNATFNWRVINITGAIGGTALNNTGTGNLNEILTNTSGFAGTVTYEVTPVAAAAPNCTGAVQNVVITVNPEPVLNLTNDILCSHEPANYEIKLLPVNLPASTTFTWAAPSMSDGSSQGTSGTAIPMGAAGTIHINDAFVNISTAPITATYSIMATSGAGCISTQGAAARQIQFTINPRPVGANDATPDVCSNASVNYNLSNNIALLGNNLITGTTFSWVAASNGNVTGESTTPQIGATITDVIRNVTTANQIVSYTVTPTSALGCAGVPFTVSVTVRPEPRGSNAATNACSDIAVGYDLIANIADVGAGGNNLVTGTTFSWVAVSNSNVGGESLTPQSGALITDALTNVTNSNQVVIYTVTPTSGTGCNGSSFTVTVTVRPEPKGFDDTPPASCSNASLAYDLAANVSNTGAGGNNVTVGTTFSWVAADNINTTGESLTPQAGSMINNTIRNFTITNQIVVYTVTPTSADGCAGNTFDISITVRPEPRGFNDVAAICSDAALNYDLSLNIADIVNGGNNLVTGTTYTWVASANANVTGESLLPQSGAMITDALNNVTTADQIVTYTITPTSASGCVGATFTVAVTVGPEPRGFNDNSPIVCSDAVVNYNLLGNIANVGSGGNNLLTGTTFSWVAATNANVTGESTAPQTSNTINDALNNTTNLNQVVVYTVTPTSAGGCTGNPFTVSVTVRPEPLGFDDTTPIICSDAAINYNLVNNVANVGSGGNNLVAGTTFSWVATTNTNVTGESFLSPVNSSTISDVLNNVTNANQIVVYTVTPRSSDGCFGNPFTVSVTVRPEPKGFNDADFACSDAAFNYDLELNIANIGSGGNNLISGTTYSWTAASNANVSGEGSGTGSLITDVLNNVTNSNQVVVYTVTPISSNACVGNTFTVSMTVRPEPRGFNDNTPLICSDAVVNYDLLANVANTVSGGNNLITGTSFSWIAASNPNVTGESFGAPVANLTINDALNNVTSADQVVVYTVTPISADGCQGNSFTVSVTVRPEPRGFDDTTPVICSDNAVNYNLPLNVANLGSGGNNLVIGTTFSWIANANPNVTGESAVTPVSSLIISDVLNNVTNTNQVVVYTVTPTSTNGCAGNTFEISVTVQPEPEGFNDSSPIICSDDQINYVLANNVANTLSGGNNLTIGTTYSWVAAVNANVTGESTAPQAGGTIPDFLNNVTTTNQIVVYTVTPTSSNGCVGNAFNVSVTVRPEPRGFNDNSPSICSDATVNYDLVANVANTGAGSNGLTSGTTFSWIALSNAAVSGESFGAPVSGSMVNDVLTNVSGSNQIVVYQVIPTSSNGCIGNMFTVSVTVTSKPVGVVDNTPEVCSDEAISYNIQSRNINILGNSVNSLFTYTVNSSDPVNVSVAGKNRSIASNASITDTYTNLTSADVFVTYTITPFSVAGNCQGANFDIVFTIHPEPRGANLTIQRCSDDLINFDLQTIVNTAVTGNSIASEFRYTVVSSNPGAVAPGANRNIPSTALITDVYTNLSNADVNVTYTVTPISLADGCEGAPFTLTITIHPEPVGQSLAVPGCQVNLNHSIQTQVTNGLPSLFTYTVASSNALAVPPAAARVAASAANITDTYSNNSGSDVTITYTITPFNAVNPGCGGTPFTYTVTISSKPVGAPSTVTAVCSDVPIHIDPQLNITNGVISTFSWSVTFDSGLTGPTSGSGSTISGTWTNNTTGVKNAYYEITPTSGSCAGLPFVITQPINPEPVIDPSVTPRTICSDDQTNIVFGAIVGSEIPSQYDISLLFKDPDLVGVPTVGTAMPNNAIETNSFTNKLRTSGLFVRYEVTPYGPAGIGACQGDKLIVQIEVRPEPVMLPTLSNVSICSDVANGVELDTDGISITAATYSINAITVQSTGTAIAPGATVADVTSTLGNSVSGVASLSKNAIRGDKFTVLNADGAANNNTVVYNITPRSGAGCVGDPFNINLLVLPEPRFDPIAPPPVCSAEPVDLQLIQRDPTSPQIAQYSVAGITFQTGLLPGGSNILIGDVLTADANGDYIDINDEYTNPTAATLTATYSVKPIAVTVMGHTCEGDVVSAPVTIRPSPKVLQTLDKIVCNDAVNGITIGTEAGSATAGSYLIVRNAPAPGLSGGNYVAGTTRVDGVNATTIASDHLVNTQNITQQVTYAVTAYTDPGADLGIGCAGPTQTITVTVEPQILVDNLIGNNSKNDICSTDDTAITLKTLSVPSSGNVTFNFTATSAIPGVVSGILPGSNFAVDDVIEQILSNSSNNPVDVTYTVTPRANSAGGGTGCIGTPTSTIVKVEPKPRMTVAPASLTVCEGIPLAIDFSSVTVPSAGAGAMFFSLTGVVDPNTLAAPPNVSGFVTTYPTSYFVGADALNDNLTNIALGQESIRYRFTPSFVIPATTATCTGDEVSINITVSPRPVLVPFTIDPMCSGETFAVNFSSSVTQVDLASTLATWAHTSDPHVTGASNGAGYDLSQVVFNRSANPANVSYAIKARSFGCESNTINIPVQVYPTPKVTGVPSTVNVCNNGAMNVTLGSNAASTLYTWSVDNESQPTLSGAADQPTPVSGPINYTVANTSDALGNYTFEITPQVSTSLAGKVCQGDPVTLVANIAPPLDGRITTSNGTNESFLCAGSREFIFLEFNGLPLFDVVYKEGSNVISLTKQGAFKPIQVLPAATTTYELVSVKDAFGCTMNINETATVNINSTNANFSLVSPVEACAPNKVLFQYDQQAGVKYTWKWFDGPDSTAYTASANELAKIVKHTFDNPSPVGVAKYKVYLETELDDIRYPGCLKTTFQEVRVSPNVALAVFPDITTICSGETVTFTNTTQGAASHRWFVRPFGSTLENEVKTSVAASYKLTNNTAQNPAVMEVVYKADNGKCPGTTTVPITVYRAVDAAFSEGTIPPYVAGSATVTFTNTSSPIDGNDFSYEWTFGSNASPGSASGTNASIPVTYNLPGLKEVTLVATNTVAAAAGVACSDTFSKTIEILLPPLVAAFQVNPLAACFPVQLTVTDNTSTGDTYKWQVIDQSGNVAATAQAPKPIFSIVNPGTYDVFLETSSSITGQKAFAQINGIEVFENPVASLEARPTTLFIPDTELTTFNFSTGANFYVWDFADGTTSEDYEPTHFYTLEGTYELTLVAGNDHGERDIDGDGLMDGNVICYDTAIRKVIAKEGGLTKVPNAFTPNKDGPTGGVAGNGTFNDTFLPITKGVAREEGSFVMQVFDRWGTLIFESRNQNRGWDGYDRNGHLVPAGVYVFKLDLRLADGQRTTQIGDVTVIR